MEWNNILSELHAHARTAPYDGAHAKTQHNKGERLLALCARAAVRANPGESSPRERVDWTQTLIRTN